MSKNDSKNNLEASGIPLLELGQLIPEYSELRIQDIEDELQREMLIERTVDSISYKEMLDAFVIKRVQEYKLGKRKPEEHLAEFRAIMTLEGIKCRHNMMLHRNEVICKKWQTLEVLGQVEEQRVDMVEETLKKYNFPIRRVDKYIRLASEPYHPVYEWINSKEWDQKDRFEELFKSLNCKNKDLNLAKVYVWKWSLAGCRAILTQKGFVSENVLVFKGVQGAGKTRWLNALAPDGFVKTGLQLNPSNKDSVLEACSVWITELGELDGTTTKSDTASLKSFFSKGTDHIRKPYGKAEELMPRKTIFCASVNTDTFLVDDTGNRRYWVLEIGEANPQHGIDMQQYWKQIMETALKDKEFYPHWLTKEEAELQDTESDKFRDLHPICQKILEIENELINDKYTTQQIGSLIGHETLSAYESKIIKQFMLGTLKWGLETRSGRQYYLINPNVSHGYKKGEGYEVLF